MLLRTPLAHHQVAARKARHLRRLRVADPTLKLESHLLICLRLRASAVPRIETLLLIFLLFFLGLEFSLERLARSGRHAGVGGTIDLVLNAGLGLVVGVAAFGFSFGALVVAAAVYVSSSAVIVKGLIDFRRLADDETDLILAILIFEDLVLALVLGFVGSGGGEVSDTLWALAAGTAGVWLRRSRWYLGVKRWVTGIVFVGLGVSSTRAT